MSNRRSNENNQFRLKPKIHTKCNQGTAKIKQELRKKTDQLVKELTEVGIPVIENNMQKANYTYDSKGVRSGSDTEHYTHVKINAFDTKSIANLIVEGKEVLFIEFGAGVYYNGSAGASPHPKGQEFGFLIGSYGAGHGQQKVWGYYDETGELVMTHGVEATMPLFKAEQKIIDEYVSVAKRVFGK